MLRVLALVLAFALPSSRCAPVDGEVERPSGANLQGESSGHTATAAQDADDQASAEGQRMPLGINLPGLSARDTSVAFWDVFLQSSRWYPWSGDPNFGLRKKDRQALAGRPRPEMDQQGWPILADRQQLFTRIFEAAGGRYPGGEYTCTWRGEGPLEFAGDASMGKITTTKDEEGKLHSAKVKVRPGRTGIVLVLKGDRSKDYVRDIHLYLPGYEEATGPFYDTFLARLEPFGTLRFANWGSVYTNKGIWSERTELDDCRQSGAQGVAIEWMIELCNTTDSNPWFCMPHLADDEYVRNFAELVRAKLEPGRRVFVEYSNETWNGIFPEAKWINKVARSRQEKPAVIVAEETSRDFAIWEEVFAAREGEQEGPLELVRLIGGALHNPGFARGVMGAMTSGFEAVAVAPYFGVRPDKDPVGRNSSAKELLDTSYDNIDAHLVPRLREHAKLAEAATRRLGHPVRLLVYEGGQTLIARRSTTPGDTRMAFPEKTILEAQYAKRMADCYQLLLERCQEVGVELFMAFHLCAPHNQASTFGLLEWIDQPLEQSVKYRALLDWIADED